MRRAALILSLALVITGCARLAESRLNPANWFGRSTQAAVTTPQKDVRPLTPAATTTVTDTRPAIAQIVDLRIDATPGGAIIVATGLSARQGAFNAELVLTGVEGSTLVYQLRAQQPQSSDIGTEASRRVTVAHRLSAQDLSGVSAIRVEGATNARVSRR